MGDRILGKSRSRATALVMGMTILLFGAASGILGPLLPAIGLEFGITIRQTGWLLFLTFAGGVAAIMAGGYLADSFGKKRLFLVLLGGLTLAYLGNFAAATFALVAVCCLLAGALGGSLESLCSAVVADLDPRRVHQNMNLLQVTFCVGALVGVGVAAELRGQLISWRSLYGIFACCAAGIWLCGLCIHVPAGPPGEPIRPGTVWLLLSDSVLCRLALAIALYVGAEMSLAWLITPILLGKGGYSEPVAIWGAGVFWGSMALARMGIAQCCRCFEAAGLIRVLVVGGLGSLMVFLLPLGPWRYWVGLVMTGTFFSGIWPLLVAMANVRHRSYSGTTTAVMVTCGTLGGLVGPAVAVRLLASDPSAGATLAFIFGLFVALAIVVWPAAQGSLRRTRNFF